MKDKTEVSFVCASNSNIKWTAALVYICLNFTALMTVGAFSAYEMGSISSESAGRFSVYSFYIVTYENGILI